MTQWKALALLPRKKTAIKKLGRSMGYKPVDCAFLELNFHDRAGVHGATPSELLHLMFVYILHPCVVSYYFCCVCRYLGVVKDAADNTLATLQRMCSSTEDLQLRLRVLSERLRHVPRFKCRNKQSRKFASGVLSFDFDKMTGEDYLHLLTQLPLVFGEGMIHFTLVYCVLTIEQVVQCFL